MLSAHLECFGSGADVVLLHGTPVAPEHLHPLAHELGAECRVWVAHLPGYGRTPALPAGHSVADIQEAVERALVARGVSSAALVGQSAGAYHALGMALRGTVEARAVVALGGLAGFATAQQSGYRELAVALRGGLDPAHILPEMLLPAAFAEAHPEAVEEVHRWGRAKAAPLLADELEALAGSPDLTPWLGELDIPIVARVGDQDVAVPPAYSEALARAARRGVLEIVPGAGHALLLQDLAGTVRSVRAALAAAAQGA